MKVKECLESARLHGRPITDQPKLTEHVVQEVLFGVPPRSFLVFRFSYGWYGQETSVRHASEILSAALFRCSGFSFERVEKFRRPECGLVFESKLRNKSGGKGPHSKFETKHKNGGKALHFKSEH